MAVNWNFVQKEEQTRRLGYVPIDTKGRPIENSGLTIATGVDLGQMNQRQIRGLFHYGLSESLINKLLPFAKDGDFSFAKGRLTTCGQDNEHLTVKKQNSVCKDAGLFDRQTVVTPRDKPVLSLDEGEVTSLDKAVREQKIKVIEGHFNNLATAGGGKRFVAQSEGAQTVVASFCWQNGENCFGRLGRKDKQAIGESIATENRVQAVLLLVRFGRSYGHFPRRRREADLIENECDTAERSQIQESLSSP